ncbi:unnamed protein product [Litomosoides sigmodontis]|uniref:AAA+ ATPase domain-containing protein n=1 Tax=Litomosoides sigmodontis TaxID=42156 RepID=A0A3P6TB07_LITSI|nr:unnamed protein product [Litomosoides sigmodontis]
MDPDVYNEVGANFADGSLDYGVMNERNDMSADNQNNAVRRPPKRIMVPCNCDALDWHMRVNCENYEKERNMRRELFANEMVERLIQRISWARKRHCLINPHTNEEETKQSVSSMPKKSEVFLYPPSGGTPWIGFTAPTILQRFYIMLRSTEQTIGERNSDKLRSDALNFDYTKKVLNSGLDFEVPDTVPEDFEEEYALVHDKLWVDKYAPHTYTDLISDETVNRLLLNWLKLWDECVFHRAIPDVVLTSVANQQQLILSSEKPRRPLPKVVLLAGPAGTGKTTLATLVAQHAGYRVVSLNASDERNIVNFEKCFEDSLRTTRTLDAGSKPNCLILDEIDGAPTQSIHYLCKTIAATGRHSLRRPVICICNNLYNSSLRELRSVGLVLQLSRIDKKRLTKRLLEKLSEALPNKHSGLSLRLDFTFDCVIRDLRSAINSLQFIASKNCAKIDRKVVLKFCAREKQFGDKSLFDSWASVFEISRHVDINGHIHDVASRVKQISLISELYGSETDRFYMGLFTNYLNSKNANVLINASMAIRELCYYDRIVTTMNNVQDYNLLKYLSAVCVSIHMLLCCRGRTHLSFPTEYQTALQRCEQSVEIVESIRAGAMQKSLSLSTVALEILPYLIYIVQPDFKPMNTQLYSVRELNVLHSIVSIMRTYSLTFTSVSQDGSVSFVFKPAIDELVMFTDDNLCHNNRSLNTLSNAARQLVAHEIELQKLRNVDALADESVGTLTKDVRSMKPGKFGAGIMFCYNSGSSSAIRRQIMIKNLFSS